MDCTESITLLSDLHDEQLADPLRAQVESHLSGCPPCTHVFSELEEIVNVALKLNQEPKIDFPDEDNIWRRMRIMDPKIH